MKHKSLSALAVGTTPAKTMASLDIVYSVYKVKGKVI